MGVLSWNHGDHRLVFAAPSYAFRIDDTGRLTDEGRAEKAVLLTEALLALQGGGKWACPTIQLAEWSDAGIRLVCEAQEGLVVDAGDPFGAGKLAGFALEGGDERAKITAVEVDKDDPKAVLLRCSKRPEGEVFVTYAHACDPAVGPYPANRGAARRFRGRCAALGTFAAVEADGPVGMAFDAESIRDDNICVIWVDDMIDVFTWRETFGIRIQTPNLDRLLNAGVRFGNAYATVPLKCRAGRKTWRTGLSPFRTGLVDLNRFWRQVLPPEKAWAYDLRRAGFYTFTTGKVDAIYKPMPERYRRVLFHEDPMAFDLAMDKDEALP